MYVSRLAGGTSAGMWISAEVMVFIGVIRTGDKGIIMDAFTISFPFHFFNRKEIDCILWFNIDKFYLLCILILLSIYDIMKNFVEKFSQL